MKDKLKFAGFGFHVTATIGGCILVLIIWLSIWFRFEFSIILLGAGSIVGAAGTIFVLNKFDLFRHERAMRRQDLRLKKAQADRAEIESYVLSFPSSQRQLVSRSAPVRLIEATAAKELPANIQPPVNLLDVIGHEQRVLIKGVSNAGKTNLLQWIASRKQGKVLVIDPHSSPNKWGGCQVVGLGSNHSEIEIALDKLIALMIERYRDIAAGTVQEGQHSKLTIIIDEWMSIAYECQNAKEAMVRLLTESRKAAFSIYIGSHSDRVASLGLDGKGDLRDGFCLVRLYLANGERSATIDYGNGEQAALLPGLFSGPRLESDGFINLEVEPTPQEARILQLHKQGESKRNICEQVFGYVSSNKYPEIDAVVSKFNGK